MEAHLRSRAEALPAGRRPPRQHALRPPSPPGCAACATPSRGCPCSPPHMAPSLQPACNIFPVISWPAPSLSSQSSFLGCTVYRVLESLGMSTPLYSFLVTRQNMLYHPASRYAQLVRSGEGAHRQREGAEGVSVVPDALLWGGGQEEADSCLEVSQRDILYHPTLLHNRRCVKRSHRTHAYSARRRCTSVTHCCFVEIVSIQDVQLGCKAQG